jgi:hypothetical protein
MPASGLVNVHETRSTKHGTTGRPLCDSPLLRHRTRVVEAPSFPILHRPPVSPGHNQGGGEPHPQPLRRGPRLAPQLHAASGIPCCLDPCGYRYTLLFRFMRLQLYLAV